MRLIARIMPFLIFLSCLHNQTKLQNGDILFVGEDGGLSTAINRVTQTEKKTNYTHMAICYIDDKGGKWILDANPISGTEKQELSVFIATNKDVPIHIYRLKPAYRNSIPDAIGKAHNMLGKAYNFSYLLNDSSHYCSEYIFKAFIKDSIFEMNPMTFVNPATNETDSLWIGHYSKLGIEVPEGKLGCNPNGMASSEKIEFEGVFNITKN